MRLGSAALHLPTPVKLSRPFRVPAGGPPKIRALRITPLDDGSLHLKHSMSHGNDKNFTFQNPKLMTQHLKRITENEWLRPMQDPANRTVRVLDIGALP